MDNFNEFLIMVYKEYSILEKLVSRNKEDFLTEDSKINILKYLHNVYNFDAILSQTDKNYNDLDHFLFEIYEEQKKHKKWEDFTDKELFKIFLEAFSKNQNENQQSQKTLKNEQDNIDEKESLQTVVNKTNQKDSLENKVNKTNEKDMLENEVIKTDEKDSLKNEGNKTKEEESLQNEVNKTDGEELLKNKQDNVDQKESLKNKEDNIDEKESLENKEDNKDEKESFKNEENLKINEGLLKNIDINQEKKFVQITDTNLLLKINDNQKEKLQIENEFVWDIFDKIKFLYYQKLNLKKIDKNEETIYYTFLKEMFYERKITLKDIIEKKDTRKRFWIYLNLNLSKNPIFFEEEIEKEVKSFFSENMEKILDFTHIISFDQNIDILSQNFLATLKIDEKYKINNEKLQKEFSEIGLNKKDHQYFKNTFALLKMIFFYIIRINKEKTISETNIMQNSESIINEKTISIIEKNNSWNSNINQNEYIKNSSKNLNFADDIVKNSIRIQSTDSKKNLVKFLEEKKGHKDENDFNPRKELTEEEKNKNEEKIIRNNLKKIFSHYSKFQLIRTTINDSFDNYNNNLRSLKICEFIELCNDFDFFIDKDKNTNRKKLITLYKLTCTSFGLNFTGFFNIIKHIAECNFSEERKISNEEKDKKEDINNEDKDKNEDINNEEKENQKEDIYNEEKENIYNEEKENQKEDIYNEEIENQKEDIYNEEKENPKEKINVYKYLKEKKFDDKLYIKEKKKVYSTFHSVIERNNLEMLQKMSKEKNAKTEIIPKMELKKKLNEKINIRLKKLKKSVLVKNHNMRISVMSKYSNNRENLVEETGNNSVDMKLHCLRLNKDKLNSYYERAKYKKNQQLSIGNLSWFALSKMNKNTLQEKYGDQFNPDLFYDFHSDKHPNFIKINKKLVFKQKNLNK